MRNFQLFVCTKDSELSEMCSDASLQAFNFKLVSASDAYSAALPVLRGFKLDAIIIDQLDDLETLFEFVDDVAHVHQPPFIAVRACNMDGGKQRILQRLGASICFDTTVPVDAVLETVSKQIAMQSAEENCIDKALEERLASIFIASGIPPHIKGYQFLKEAVKQSVHRPSMVNNITKQLYPAIADKFNTSPSKVERAIRHAIEVAWSRGKIENINAMYGIKVFSKEEKPTNGELIALVSDKLIIECS